MRDYLLNLEKGIRLNNPSLEGISGVKPIGKLIQVLTKNGTCLLKPCSKCKRILPLHEFDTKRGCCKECRIYSVRQWQKRNPEMVKTSSHKAKVRYMFKKKSQEAVA